MNNINPNIETPRGYLSYLQSQYIQNDLKQRNLYEIPLEEQIKMKKEHLELALQNEEMHPAYSQHNDKKKNKFIKRYINEFIKFKMDPNFEYENFETYNAISAISKDVEKISKKLKIKIKNKPVIGTLPTGQINATSIKVPNGGFVVCMNVGTFGFINLMSKVLTSFIPLKDKVENETFAFSYKIDDINNSFEKNKEAINRFQDILLSYQHFGDPHEAEQYFIDPIQARLANIFTDMAEFFIVSHEYAHIMLGHFENSQCEREIIGNNEIDMLYNNWQEEFSADHLATILTINYGLKKRKLDFFNSYSGIDFFFTCVDILEKANNVGENKSHPPAIERRDFLIDVGLPKLGFDKKGIENIKEYCHTHRYIMDKCWKLTEPNFINKK